MPNLTVPNPHAVVDLTMEDGAMLRIRRHGNPEGPRLVLCHGNGFAIDAYFPFWRHLTSRFDLILYDQRNHGQNPRHDPKTHDLSKFVSDMETVFWKVQKNFDSKPAVGVFHSISGVTSVWHALQHGKRWDALALFDPALIPGPGLPEHEVARRFELMLANWARQRRSDFSDPTELAEHFRKSYSLRRWVAGAHALMAGCILRQEPGAAWSLCCPPECESRIYARNAELHLTHRFPELPAPVKLICGDPAQPDAKAPCKVGRSLHVQYGCSYEAVPDTSHMLQIENPDGCVRALLSFLQKIGFIF